ncbi:hypothetical protein [Kitasatospora sp. NPDC086791]|uniref:hypothetical protein n=1 Tax=Kitasatospora sp. NPDC086791 TaxID=3155178 RepID=UPI00341B34F9
MARIRTIKPTFFTSLTIADLTAEQRLTFIGLWTHVDDDGRCVDDPRLIKAAVWPLDDRSAADIESDLRALSESSLIVRYILNRKRFMAVSNWHEHQRINRPTPSELPDPADCEIQPPPPHPTCGNEGSGSTHAQLSESSLPERKGKEWKGREGNRDVSPTGEPHEDPLNGAGAAAADKPRGTTLTPIRIDVEQACTLLADLIEANGSRRPTITQQWRDECRRMIDRDGVPLEDVLGAIRWSQGDPFWCSNVLSMPKLRKQYDTLRLQAQRGRGTALAPTGTSGPQHTGTDARIAEHYAVLAEMEAERNR